MVSIGNQDLVQVNGNQEGTRVVITNFNQPQGNPEMGHPRTVSSKYWLQISRGPKKIALIVANKGTQILIVGAIAQHAVRQGTVQGHANYHQKKVEEEKKEKEEEKNGL